MWSGKISSSSNDILSVRMFNQLHIVRMRLFLTGTELENAQWKWLICGARNYLQYLLVISRNKQKQIWKVLKKSGIFYSGFIFYLGTNLSVFTFLGLFFFFFVENSYDVLVCVFSSVIKHCPLVDTQGGPARLCVEAQM